MSVFSKDQFQKKLNKMKQSKMIVAIVVIFIYLTFQNVLCQKVTD